MQTNTSLNRNYLKLQVEDNYERFRVIPALAGIVCLVFFVRNTFLIVLQQARPDTTYYFYMWLAGVISSFGSLYLFHRYRQQENYQALDFTMFFYVLIMCGMSGVLSALDSHAESNLTVYAFSIAGAATAYRTSTARYGVIIFFAAAIYLFFHTLILDGPINFNIIAPLISVSVLSSFIAASLEKNKKHLVLLTLELERANEKLMDDSIKDHMTKLYNRRYLNDILPREIARFERGGDYLCLAMCDLDFFKDINDQYGHLVGDQVLIDFSNLVLEESRNTDIVIRYGGEEFLIIMPRTTMPAAQNLVERIREKLALHKFEEVNKKLTASFGITQIRQGDSLDSLLDRTDQLLYHAKANGRNCVKSDFDR
jgi:diguanylate cyclase (GGDEF)-like protein